MNILFVAPELQGFAKVGGLADVAKGLPIALHDLGNDVRIVLPYYQQVSAHHDIPIGISSLRIPMGNTEVWCAVRQLLVNDVPVYFLEHNGFFDRPRLYDDGLFSYVDNADRFAFLSKGALQLCKQLAFRPHVVHSNDWTTALVPFFLKVHERDGFFVETASVLTIHNGYFQGKFYGDKRYFIGIPDRYFVPDVMEDQGGVNFMKAGLYFADKINAVSPSYAKELLTSEGGHGLHQYVARRANDIRGILNGCDYCYWNPETDVLLPANYSHEDLSGKAMCKTELEKAFAIEVVPARPLFGMVCRLTEQKGFGYIMPALRKLLEEDVALVILGEGDPCIERDLYQLAEDFHGKVGYRAGYDEKLAHLVYAGSDLFLMPSLFEPCGSSQMYSMRYGALPVVRAVGGLKDTVWDFDEHTGTGFVFEEPSPKAVYHCLQRSIHVYRESPRAFGAMVQRAMQERFDWRATAQQYLEMYRQGVRRGEPTRGHCQVVEAETRIR